MSERQATEATATRTLGLASTACLLEKFLRPSEFGENNMITHSKDRFGQVVTTIKAPKSSYGTDTYALRDSKGKHVGTLCITSNGVVVLTSSSGHKLTDAPR